MLRSVLKLRRTTDLRKCFAACVGFVAVTLTFLIFYLHNEQIADSTRRALRNTDQLPFGSRGLFLNVVELPQNGVDRFSISLSRNNHNPPTAVNHSYSGSPKLHRAPLPRSKGADASGTNHNGPELDTLDSADVSNNNPEGSFVNVPSSGGNGDQLDPGGAASSSVKEKQGPKVGRLQGSVAGNGSAPEKRKKDHDPGPRPQEFEKFEHLTDLCSTWKVEHFPAWTTKEPDLSANYCRVYPYSAIIDVHALRRNIADVHVVSFQDSRDRLDLTCCLQFPATRAVLTGKKADLIWMGRRRKSRGLDPAGVIFKCSFAFSWAQMRGAHLALSTATTCPEVLEQFLTIHLPVRRPGGLAICAKIIYGFNLNYNKLVTWFEIQQRLGVDRVQMFDFNNTEKTHRLLRHYQDLGMLTLLPYTLPGRPWGRSLVAQDNFARNSDDEEVPLWDCKLRSAGHDYVMDIDTDEVVMPRHFSTLKPFLKDQFSQHEDAASLNFMVQFFLKDWGPVEPRAPLLFLQYLNSTVPRMYVTKHVYLPSRIINTDTHYVTAFRRYQTTKFVDTSEGTVFHYRSCKSNWHFSCDDCERVTDRSIEAFGPSLVSSVASVMDKTGINFND